MFSLTNFLFVLCFSTPLRYAGTFYTLIRSAENLGNQLYANLNAPMRRALNDLGGTVRCNGGSDTFGKYLYVNKTTNHTMRYCGEHGCQFDPPIDAQTSFCNPLGDGYVRWVLICMCLAVLFYLFMVQFAVPFLDVSSLEFDPENQEERIPCCPHLNQEREERGQELFSHDYTELPDADELVDSSRKNKNSWVLN